MDVNSVDDVGTMPKEVEMAVANVVGGEPMLPAGDDSELSGERMSLMLDGAVVREAGLDNTTRWLSDEETEDVL